MRRHATLVATGVLALALFASPRSAAASSITVNPASSTLAIGDTLTLDVAVADVTDLYDFQFDLNFNPAVVQFTGFTDGGFLTSGGGTSVFDGLFLLTADNTAGVVTLLDSLLGPVSGVSGAGLLASLSFIAIADGVSSLTLDNVILENSLAAAITADISNGTTTVGSTGPSPVPEPSSMVLLGTGLALAAARRVRGRRAQPQ